MDMKKIIFLIAFTTLALSFFAQAKKDTVKKEEILKIKWPQEFRWKVVTDQEDKTTHFVEIIPGDEDVNKWDTIGTMMILKDVKVSSAEKIAKMYKRSSRSESPKSK